MANANEAILITLDAAHEGGFQNNPHDRANWTGGQVGVGTLVGTNGGITALDMPGADIKNLTTVQKVAYYIEHYWKPYYSSIVNQPLANKIFDLGVLFGIGESVKNIQHALGVATDGVFGQNTLLALNSCANPAFLLDEFKSLMKAHAKAVAVAKPEEAYALPDWLRRIDS